MLRKIVSFKEETKSCDDVYQHVKSVCTALPLKCDMREFRPFQHASSALWTTRMAGKSGAVTESSAITEGTPGDTIGRIRYHVKPTSHRRNALDFISLLQTLIIKAILSTMYAQMTEIYGNEGRRKVKQKIFPVLPFLSSCSRQTNSNILSNGWTRDPITFFSNKYKYCKV